MTISIHLGHNTLITTKQKKYVRKLEICSPIDAEQQTDGSLDNSGGLDKRSCRDLQTWSTGQQSESYVNLRENQREKYVILQVGQILLH